MTTAGAGHQQGQDISRGDVSGRPVVVDVPVAHREAVACATALVAVLGAGPFPPRSPEQRAAALEHATTHALAICVALGIEVRSHA